MNLVTVMIVEGKYDKQQIKKVLTEKIQIICTFGTFGIEKFDDMLEKYCLDDCDVFILVDADESGEELRKKLNRELPHAYNLYIPEEFREVEATPLNVLARILLPHFEVNINFLM